MCTCYTLLYFFILRALITQRETGCPMNRLLQESKGLLEQQLPQDADICMYTASLQPRLLAMADFLTAYEMEHRNRCIYMGCYWLLIQSLDTHKELPIVPQAAGRAVLDGDFLMSFYLQFALKHKKLDLITVLASTLKRLQIRHTEGIFEDEPLFIRFSHYIDKQYSRRQLMPQRFKQVTYDVI